MSKENQSQRRYCRKVGHYLICGRETKSKLLAGLYEEITNDKNKSMTYAQIVEAYGAPKSAAQSLQAVIEEDEANCCRRRKTVLLCIVLVILAIAFAISAYIAVYMVRFVRHNMPVSSIEEISEGPFDESDDISWVECVD